MKKLFVAVLTTITVGASADICTDLTNLVQESSQLTSELQAAKQGFNGESSSDFMNRVLIAAARRILDLTSKTMSKIGVSPLGESVSDYTDGIRLLQDVDSGEVSVGAAGAILNRGGLSRLDKMRLDVISRAQIASTQCPQ